MRTGVAFNKKAATGDVIARGYRRVVYGDHGPYVELDRESVVFSALQLNEVKCHPNRYYDEWFSRDGLR